jgi:hypothetical protein
VASSAAAVPTAEVTLQVALAGADTAAFRAALVRHGVEDQAIRDTLVGMMQGTRAFDAVFSARMTRGDSVRAAWLAGEVSRFGWPGSIAFGKEATGAAFLFVQHAVQDTAFQVRMLAPTHPSAEWLPYQH